MSSSAFANRHMLFCYDASYILNSLHMTLIHYNLPIYIAPGARTRLLDECLRLNIKKPMFVTDQGIVNAGVLQQVMDVLPSEQACHVFKDTPPNPTVQAVALALTEFKAARCDGLIAVGGGSSIDCAKGVALMAHHGGALQDYAKGGTRQITADTLPLIAVPTTAGTGSEVSRGAVITTAEHRKIGVSSWHLLPKVALCDPELVMGLSPFLTAATGMDALAHCIETYLSPLFNPAADGMAIEGLRRGWSSIASATENGKDLGTRQNMMVASVLGALSFQKGLACVHSISHSLGGMYPLLHHGTLNAILLPAVIRFNADAVTVTQQSKYARIREAMSLDPDANISDAISQMNARLKLPAGLAQMQVKASDFAAVIRGAFADSYHSTGPKTPNSADYERMLVESM